ncbi:MAG: hypothetical protein DRP57_04320 [Spirochaetes bacterium]|nr:MAG: hypothetical protein DRP57_04320 [Spirochaetota bacterium]
MNEEYWSKRKGLLAERSSLTNNEIVKPSHYRLCGEDSMPLIEKILGTEGYLAFLKGNVLKYRIRCGKKKGQSIEKDVAKAMYYEELYDNFVIQNQPS